MAKAALNWFYFSGNWIPVQLVVLFICVFFFIVALLFDRELTHFTRGEESFPWSGG